jgi:hypothetical protein
MIEVKLKIKLYGLSCAIILVILSIFSHALQIYQNTYVRYLGNRYTQKHVTKIVFITSGIYVVDDIFQIILIFITSAT